MVKKFLFVLSLSTLLMVGGCGGVKELPPAEDTEEADPKMIEEQQKKAMEFIKGKSKEAGKAAKLPDSK